MKKKQRKKNEIAKIIATDTLMIFLAGVSFTSAYKLYSIKNTYKVNQKEYTDLSKEVEEEPEELLEIKKDKDNKEENKEKKQKKHINFDKLKQINPDIEGWIKYEDTIMDYPIVQGDDNNKYLKESFEGNTSSFGTLFIDSGCSEPFEDFTTIIYGHNMKNGSMFGALKKLKDEDYCKEHSKLELYTPDKDYYLEICAFLNQPEDCQAYQINIYDEQDKENYINTIKALASYQTNTQITTNDKLVVLSTCSYEFTDARYIVICKLTDQNTYNKTTSINNEKKLVKKLY